MPKLYVIATPIGNLQEMTPRAISALQTCAYAFCEDTRISGKLMHLLNVHPAPKLIAHHKFNEQASLTSALTLLQTHDCALLSDAGYPALSDPGQRLIQAVYSRLPTVKVEVINGANAALCALVASGFAANNFYFAGFLDRNDLANEIQHLLQINSVIIIYEAVHRIDKTLQALAQYAPDKQICVARELTKCNETLYFGTAETVLKQLTYKGEFVIVINNQTDVQKKSAEITLSHLKALSDLCALGVRTKDACKYVSKHLNTDASLLYHAWLKNKK